MSLEDLDTRDVAAAWQLHPRGSLKGLPACRDLTCLGLRLKLRHRFIFVCVFIHFMLIRGTHARVALACMPILIWPRGPVPIETHGCLCCARMLMYIRMRRILVWVFAPRGLSALWPFGSRPFDVSESYPTLPHTKPLCTPLARLLFHLKYMLAQRNNRPATTHARCLCFLDACVNVMALASIAHKVYTVCWPSPVCGSHASVFGIT